MHRVILDEPMSQAAALSRSTALFALTVAVLGIAMARKGLDPTAAVAIEGGAVAMAGLAILFALAAAAVIWRTGYRGTGRLLMGLLLAAIVLAYPAYILDKLHRIPVVPDVSTDPADPPVFSHGAPAVSARNGQTPGPPAAVNLDAQRRLYPDLQPVQLDEEAQEAYKAVLKVVTAHRWTILEAVPPAGRAGRLSAGHIDAVATSLVMGFPADIAIRIRPIGTQTRIDIRSVSRTKWHEPDADARRVQTLAGQIEDEAGG